MTHAARPLLCGFMKVRNEVVREGNIYRALANLSQYCDGGVVLDDGSSDGTWDVIQQFAEREWEFGRRWIVGRMDPTLQAFGKELLVKQEMLVSMAKLRPLWVLWQDGDEVLDAKGTATIREWVQSLGPMVLAAKIHYQQFWRTTSWARTDAGFDDGWFLKLWRWHEDLSFEIKPGTHHAQFPQQLMPFLKDEASIPKAPFECLHYGNAGVNLRWKCLQYWGGLGGVDRHLKFDTAGYRYVPDDQRPSGAEGIAESATPPLPYTRAEQARILSMQGLRVTPGWFTVVIPAYNRADTLDAALQSLLDQTYPKWVAVVLDDGSTDDTSHLMRRWQDKDQRVFYARYPENRGGVAMNEIGMALACEWTEYWTRLGSDDWFEPLKLELDAYALQYSGACFGPYRVHRAESDKPLDEWCNPPMTTGEVKTALLGERGFVASWANAAVKTSVLRQVRMRFGSFCDPRLRNMEDFLVNARIALEDKWVWRAMVDGKPRVLMGEHDLTLKELWKRSIGDAANHVPQWQVKGKTIPFEHDAVWRCVRTGASGNVGQTVLDDHLTRRIIAGHVKGAA